MVFLQVWGREFYFCVRYFETTDFKVMPLVFDVSEIFSVTVLR